MPMQTMQHARDVVKTIIQSETRPGLPELLNTLLPPGADVVYSLADIDQRLNAMRVAIEEYQQESNCNFEDVLDHDVVDRISNLNQKIQDIQLNIMNFQCNLTYTKEQSERLDRIATNSTIRERKAILAKEEKIRRDLQRLKFEPVRNFYDRFTKHLKHVITSKRRQSATLTPNHLQLFDWTQFQHTMFLLRACGKGVKDLEIFERLYQSSVNINRMALKQPIDQIDFNNYIEFPETYSLDFQLDISVDAIPHRDLIDLLRDPKIQPLLDSDKPIEFIAFGPTHNLMDSVAVECCKLLVELNMNYIEAHFTDGINIDSLNGGENSSLGLPENEAMPSYAFSPQDFITQIGQHLLTLRKQSEYFDSIENRSLKFGLEYLERAQDIPLNVKGCKSVTEIVMQCISRHCIRSMLGRTGNSLLSKLSLNGRRQLGTDALYLDNVLEDLKLLDPVDVNVSKFKKLLIQP